eukprot:9509993-Lingulodinium_polyedra.AAC.1
MFATQNTRGPPRRAPPVANKTTGVTLRRAGYTEKTPHDREDPAAQPTPGRTLRPTSPLAA